MQALPHQVPKFALYPVPYDRSSHCPADHEPDDRAAVPSAHPYQVHHHPSARRPPAPTDHEREVPPAGQPRRAGQHGAPFRPTAGSGPCGAGPRRWHDPLGCASAAGNRACVPGDGCSAGRCACPCSQLPLSRLGFAPVPGCRSPTAPPGGRRRGDRAPASDPVSSVDYLTRSSRRHAARTRSVSAPTLRAAILASAAALSQHRELVTVRTSMASRCRAQLCTRVDQSCGCSASAGP